MRVLLIYDFIMFVYSDEDDEDEDDDEEGETETEDESEEEETDTEAVTTGFSTGGPVSHWLLFLSVWQL